jgi:hypothetical protein
MFILGLFIGAWVGAWVGILFSIVIILFHGNGSASGREPPQD